VAVRIAQTVHLISPDRQLLEQFVRTLAPHSILCSASESLDEFTSNSAAENPNCVLIDARSVPAQRLREWVAQSSLHVSVIVLCDAGDLLSATLAMKAGAVDVIQRNAAGDDLVLKVQNGIREGARRLTDALAHLRACRRVALLSDRELTVARLLSLGLSNKQIATRLKISVNTVGNHRASIHLKLQTDSTAQLVRTMMVSSCPHLISLQLEETGNQSRSFSCLADDPTV